MPEYSEDEQARLFDRFFPEMEPDVEKRVMEKAYETVEDDIDDAFWHSALRTHLGKEVFENAEAECVKAAVRGETALADILGDEIERQKRLDAEIEKDPDSSVPEMRVYLDIIA